MKKFLKFGKSKKGATPEASPDAKSEPITPGYTVKDKDLGKLHKAAWTGDLAKVKQLAKKDPSPLDKENRTPLHFACVKGHTDIIEELLSWKAKLNVGDNNQCTPLMKAVQCHKQAAVKLLLEQKVDTDNQDKQGNSCLHYCAMDGLYDMTSMLIHEGAKIDIKNKEGQTPLHISVLERQQDVSQLLLEEGADINVKDGIQRTPIMHACSEGNINLVKLLLSFKADTSLKDSKGWTADDCAMMAGQHACSQLISDYHDKHSKTPRSAGRGKDSKAANTPTKKAKNQDGGGFNFGAPVLDAGGDISTADDSPSKASGVDGEDNSWGDTDSELPLDTPKSKKSKQAASDSEDDSAENKKKNVPKLNLAKLLRGSDESLDRAGKDSAKDSTSRSTSKIPKLKDPAKLSRGPSNASLQSNSSEQSNSRSRLPQPVSKTGSAQLNDDWDSSEESQPDSPEPIRKTNVLTPAKKSSANVQLSDQSDDDDDEEEEEEEEEEESDDEVMAALTGGVLNNGKKVNNNDAQQSPQKVKNKSKPSDIEKDKAKRKDVLAELGMSDVSEVSTPDISDLSTQRSPRRKAGQDTHRDADSDWDSTAASEPNSPRQPKQKITTRKKNTNDWDSSPESKSPSPPAMKKQPAGKPQLNMGVDEEDEDEWDSEDEDGEPETEQPNQNVTFTLYQDAESSSESESDEDADSQVEDTTSESSNADVENETVVEKHTPEPGQDEQDESEATSASVGENADPSNETSLSQAQQGQSQKAQDDWDSGSEAEDQLEIHEQYAQHLENSQDSESEGSQADTTEQTTPAQPAANTDEQSEDEDQDGDVKCEDEGEESKDSEWDSDVEDALVPTPVQQPTPSPVVDSQEASKQDEDPSLYESDSSYSGVQHRNVTPLDAELRETEQRQSTTPEVSSGKGKAIEQEEDSEWDSDDGMLPSESQDAPVKKSFLTGVPGESEEEPTESESEWERERKKEQEQRQKQWEEEERRKKEELKKQAEEELRQEKEEQERQRRLADEERREKERQEAEKKAKERLEKERKEQEEKERREREEREQRQKEELERQKQEQEEEMRRKADRERQERERKAKELKDKLERERKDREERERVERETRESENKLRQEREQRERERLEHDKKEKERREEERRRLEEEERLEEQRQDREQQELLDRVRKEIENKEQEERQARQNREDLSKLPTSPGFEEKSRQIRLRREKAEKELEEARRRRERKTSGSHHSINSADEASNFDDSEESGSPQQNKINGHLSPSNPYNPGHNVNHNQDNEDEDDGLSYSSSDNSDMNPVPYTSSPYKDLLNTSLTLNDSTGLMRMQDQLREQAKALEKERSARTMLENRRKQWEKEKTDMLKKIDDLGESKSSLEQIKLELEARIRNFEYSLNEETEKKKNAEVLLAKTKQQLSRKEEQYTHEVELRQKTELSMRNLQMELRSSKSSVRQLEEEKDDLQKQVNHEKNQRLLQEQIYEEQVRVHQQFNEEANRTTTLKDQELADIMSKLESADTGKKTALDAAEKLRAELYAVKMELERYKSRHKDDHDMLTTENEDLHTRMEELKNEIKLNEEALAHATMQYNVQISHMKTENSALVSNLEREKSTKDKFETEIESLKTLLTAANLELEKTRHARNELEKNMQKEKEEWNRLQEKRDAEIGSLKESNQNLTQRMTSAETKVSGMENDCKVANASLMEKMNHVADLQRELDQRRTAQENLDQNWRREKENNAKVQAKLEAAQERVTGLQHEIMSLKQQVDDARNKENMKERSAMDTQDKFTVMLNSLRSDHEKSRATLEDKNSHLLENVTRLKEELRSSESRKVNLEQEMKHIQHELMEATKKLSVADAAVETLTKAKESLEQEKMRLTVDIEKMSHKVENAQERETESRRRVTELSEKLEKTEQNSLMTTQQLANTSANVEAVENIKSELEEAVHRLEIDKAKLEAALNHETQKVETLQRDLQDSHKVRSSMEALLTNYKSANAHLEDKLTQETANRSLFAKEAEESKDLWETEIKTKSKLGLKVAQLERSKQEAAAQVDEEKRKARRAADLKKVAETKLEAEIEKRVQLEKEIANLKGHLKVARKRLKDLESTESRVNNLHSEFDRERLAMEGTIQTLRRQLEELQSQLHEEIEQKEKLDVKNRQQQQELNSLKSVEKNISKLERSKRKLEDEFNMYKAHVSSNFLEHGEVERLKQNYEMEKRLEINQKLEEVNRYLEEQAQAREKLDKMRNDNEAQMRSDFEKTKKQLTDEISDLRAGYHSSMAQKETKDIELGKFKDLYENEVKLRGRLADRLHKANEQAANTKAQLSLERQKAMFLGSTPPRPNDGSWLTGTSPILAGKPSPNHGLNDSLSYRIKNELDKSIAKHLESGASTRPLSAPSPQKDDPSLPSSYSKATSDYMATLKRNYFV